MIAGVGIDLVETARFRRRGRPLLARLFSAAERRYCDARPSPELHYAARFAAKEAVLKALGTGWSGGIAWTDVEVGRSRPGQVRVKLTGTAAKVARSLGISRIHLSMSHTATAAIALAVAESAERKARRAH